MAEAAAPRGRAMSARRNPPEVCCACSAFLATGNLSCAGACLASNVDPTVLPGVYVRHRLRVSPCQLHRPFVELPRPEESVRARWRGGGARSQTRSKTFHGSIIRLSRKTPQQITAPPQPSTIPPSPASQWPTQGMQQPKVCSRAHLALVWTRHRDGKENAACQWCRIVPGTLTDVRAAQHRMTSHTEAAT
jgi:hypothetical protein